MTFSSSARFRQQVLAGRVCKEKERFSWGKISALPGPDPGVLLPSLKLRKEDSF